MTPAYKAQKEASVSHLGGGGIWEINHVTLVAPAAALLWSVLQVQQSFFKPYTVPAMATDFMLHCCAILFATTVYSSAPQVLNGLLIVPTVAMMLQSSSQLAPNSRLPGMAESNGKLDPNGKPAKDQDETAGDMDPLPVRPFLTTYRGAMMIITCISILAVDFPVFPRRFAKTESFGTSLMDVGVGSFVFAAGIVAARQQLKEQYSRAPSFVARMKTAMRHSLPLFVLGFVRLYSIKGLNYAEHVSEYGVHWNFFFTLALLPPATALIQPILYYSPSHGLLAFIIAGSYELYLYMGNDVKSYIILSERKPDDWLSQNREGVYSFAGYFAIFIAGMGIGTGILPRKPGPEAAKVVEPDPLDEDENWLASVLDSTNDSSEPGFKPRPEPPQLKPEYPQTPFFHLLKWTIIWFILTGWALWVYGPRLTASRRMANLAYVVWVCAFNSGQLLLFCSIEGKFFPFLYMARDKETERQRISDATSPVMQAFNRNGLALFLLANLLTGGINMSMETLHMGDVQAMAVLVVYIGVICATAIMLDGQDISIKL